jgi:hypothetical protein
MKELDNKSQLQASVKTLIIHKTCKINMTQNKYNKNYRLHKNSAQIYIRPQYSSNCNC